jgi:hypothetical protein
MHLAARRSVGCGILLAAELSRRVGPLQQADVALIEAAIRAAGRDPHCWPFA